LRSFAAGVYSRRPGGLADVFLDAKIEKVVAGGRVRVVDQASVGGLG
jgi:hypothetical protein